MASLRFSSSARLRRACPGAPGRANLGRLVSGPRQSVYPQSDPHLRGVSPSIALGHGLAPLPARPEYLLHDRLLFLEHGHLWFSSFKRPLARRQRLTPFRVAPAFIAFS